MYPTPRNRMKTSKSQLISVSCMKFANHCEGSKSIYNENSNATTIVTTKGTKEQSVVKKKEERFANTYGYVPWIDGKASPH